MKESLKNANSFFFIVEWTQILGCNLLGIVVTVLWAVIWCFPIFGLLKRLQLLRITQLEESTGIDVGQHRELSYPVSSWDDFCHSLFEEQSVRDWLPPLSNSMANPPLFANMTHSSKLFSIIAVHEYLAFILSITYLWNQLKKDYE